MAVKSTVLHNCVMDIFMVGGGTPTEQFFLCKVK